MSASTRIAIVSHQGVIGAKGHVWTVPALQEQI